MILEEFIKECRKDNLHVLDETAYACLCGLMDAVIHEAPAKVIREATAKLLTHMVCNGMIDISMVEHMRGKI